MHDSPPESHATIRRAVSAFYVTAGESQLARLFPIYTVEQLRQRSNYIRTLGIWGEAVDVMAFASIYRVKVSALIVTAPA